MSRKKLSAADYRQLNKGRPITSYGPDGRARVEIPARASRTRKKGGRR